MCMLIKHNLRNDFAKNVELVVGGSNKPLAFVKEI